MNDISRLKIWFGVKPHRKHQTRILTSGYMLKKRGCCSLVCLWLRCCRPIWKCSHNPLIHFGPQALEPESLFTGTVLVSLRSSMEERWKNEQPVISCRSCHVGLSRHLRICSICCPSSCYSLFCLRSCSVGSSTHLSRSHILIRTAQPCPGWQKPTPTCPKTRLHWSAPLDPER